MHAGIAALVVIGVLIVAGVLARLCVAGLVRNSIRRGVKIAADLLRHQTVDAVSPVLKRIIRALCYLVIGTARA